MIAASIYIFTGLLVYWGWRKGINKIPYNYPKPPKQIQRLVSFIIWVITLLLSVSTFVGVSPTVLISSLGASVGITALVLKDVIANALIGAKLIASGEFYENRKVRLKSTQVFGRVRKITLTQLVVYMPTTKELAFIPIQKVSSDVVIFSK